MLKLHLNHNHGGSQNLTWLASGIHPGRVEPDSPIKLTTSRTDALKVRLSCANSLETFTQSFLHRAWPKTRGPDNGPGSVLIVVAQFVCATCEAMWEGEDP